MQNFLKFQDYLEIRYMKLCPFEPNQRKKLAITTKIITLSTAVIIGIILLVWNLMIEKEMTLYGSLCIVFSGIVTCYEVTGLRLEQMEQRISKDMLDYFLKVKQKYLYGHNVPNAIFDAAREQSYEIRLYALELYEILTGSERKNKVRNYVCSSSYSKYWKMLLVQSYETSEMGDLSTENSESVFADNVEHLRMELMTELYRRRKKKYQFSGYTFVTITPVLFMSVLKNWGISFTEKLIPFYQGTGQVIVILCFLVTLYVYRSLCKTKRNGGNISEAGHEIKQFFTILWMERRFTGMTITGMLEDLETFAVLFQPVFRECLNTYSSGPKAALMRLKEQGEKKHPAFSEIGEAFLSVDEVGIESAFSGVHNSRTMLEQTERLEAEISMELRRDGLELLTKLPAFLILGCYFIIPFLISALSGVKEVFQILDELR